MSQADVNCPFCSTRQLDDVSKVGCFRCFGLGRVPSHVVKILNQIRLVQLSR